jgi:putative NADH-flavin reductase
MNLLIFGATGGTGRQLVAQALEQGHTVTAFVRVTSQLAMSHPNLNIIQGNILNAPTVMAVVFGKDVVLSALGSRKAGLPDLVVGTRNILAAMQDCDVRRSIWVSSFGVGESLKQMSWLARNLIVRGFLHQAILEKEDQERLITQSEGDWIIVRPGGLTDGPRTGVYRAIASAANEKVGRPTISRADVADFMLKNLTGDTYVHQAVGLSY